MVSMLLRADGVDDSHGLPLLRLCSFDDLEQAAIALAPVADGKRALKINVDTLTGLQDAAGVIILEAMWMLGGVLHKSNTAASVATPKSSISKNGTKHTQLEWPPLK